MDAFAAHMQGMRERELELAKQGIKIFRISATEREEFKECRRRWDFASFSRQGLEPKRAALPLQFGKCMHLVLEKFYSLQVADPDWKGAWDPEVLGELWNTLFDADIEELKTRTELSEEQLSMFAEAKQLGYGMAVGYVKWSAVADMDPSIGFYKVHFTEREFAVPLIGYRDEPFQFTDRDGQVWEIWLVGRIDMVVEDFDGGIWVLDHKTSADKLNADLLVLDDQMTVYTWAMEEILGRVIQGCYYNVLRKKLPRVPKVLVNGRGLSKDKSIDTTYDVYLQAIIDNGFDPKDYEDMLQYLQVKDPVFFERARVHRNRTEIRTIQQQLIHEAVDMLNAPYIYPNPSRNCLWCCDYRPLCIATNRGDDVAFLKESMYQKRLLDVGSVYERESTIE